MNINTKEYWNKRFSDGDWDNESGGQQTEDFGKALLSNLPSWLKQDINENASSVCDAGCAEGQLVNLINKEFTGKRACGFDFAENAIDKAKELYGETCEFYCDDVKDSVREHDVIIISNVLEHLDEPTEIIRKLSEKALSHLIIMVPYKQPELFGEHVSAFDFSSFGISAGSKVMTCCEILDLGEICPDSWNGEQLLVVYSSVDAVKRLEVNAQSVFKKYLEYKDAYERCERENKAYADNVRALSEEIEKINGEKQALYDEKNALNEENKALVDSNSTLNAEKQKYENIIASASETIQEVFDSRSYRVAKILRNLKNSGERKKIFVNILRALTGKRGLFAYLNKFDPLFLVINSFKNNTKNIPYEIQSTNETSVSARDEYTFPEIFCDNLKIKKHPKKRIAYFTNQVVDWKDFRPRYGGGEKYCLNICRLLAEYGYEIHIYQPAFEEKETEYYGFKVKTVKIGDVYSEFYITNANQFYDISLEYDHVIYNLPEMSGAKMRKDAIMICHGIWFDHNNYGSHIKFREKTWMQFLRRAFSNPLKIISVDTNSINVIRSFYPELASRMKFIPNFADVDSFYPPEERNNEKLKILFPRRSQINRGSRILGDILKRVPHDVEFYWVGEGDAEDTNIILELAKNDKRLHYEKASFTEMPDWYRKADITVIPTIACEGTSLSCIEAIASGCATVSTNVGGLTDIIYDEVNGLLTDADPISLANAINRLIEDDELRERLQKAGREYSYNFSIEKWKSKWVKVFEELKWIPKKDNSKPNVAILTKNAVHGGVETLIAAEMKYFNADCIVAGGLNNESGTCPFEYTYVDSYKGLLEKLLKYDAVIYHWIPDWAVQAVKVSGVFSIEFVHRTDTAECDKTVPQVIASHSEYILEYIKKEFGNTNLAYVPNGTDTERFLPVENREALNFVGAPTSYTDVKGIDILIEAWSKLDAVYKEKYKLVLYGRGTELEKFKQLAKKLKVDVAFNDATTNTEAVYDKLHLYVTAARIEGLPISVLEALSCNIPVIASDIEGHRIINETFEKEGSKAPLVLFKSENSDDLKKKIQEMLKNYEIQNTRETVEKIYSAKKHCEELDKIIKNHFAKE